MNNERHVLREWQKEETLTAAGEKAELSPSSNINESSMDESIAARGTALRLSIERW